MLSGGLEPKKKDRDEALRDEKLFVFIRMDKLKTSRGGGNRCRCYETRRVKLEEIEISHTRWI